MTTNTTTLRRIVLAFVFAPVLAFIAASCATTTPTLTKTELLTAKEWKLDAASVSTYVTLLQQVIPIPGIDVTAVASSIRLKYETNGAFALKTSLGTYNGTWKFLNNESQIEEKYPAPLEVLSGTHDITELSANKYAISFTFTTAGVNPIKVNATFIPAN